MDVLSINAYNKIIYRLKLGITKIIFILCVCLVFPRLSIIFCFENLLIFL